MKKLGKNTKTQAYFILNRKRAEMRWTEFFEEATNDLVMNYYRRHAKEFGLTLKWVKKNGKYIFKPKSV